jgi:hypothetical protein
MILGRAANDTREHYPVLLAKKQPNVPREKCRVRLASQHRAHTRRVSEERRTGDNYQHHDSEGGQHAAHLA